MSNPQGTTDQRKKKLDLVYGTSGTGKTTWALQMAKWFWHKHGLKTRWYLGDGGGETIRVGNYPFIEIWEFQSWKNPFDVTLKMAKGGWPIDVNDPTSKVIVEALPSDIGLLVYEGLSVIGDYMMGEQEGGLAWRMAKGEALNKDDSFRFKDGDVAVGGNARTHYGLIARRIPFLLRENLAVPVMKIWTAHQREAEDDATNANVIGPLIVGKALTPLIMGSFGNTIHLCKARTKEKVKDPHTGKMVEEEVAEYRAYIRSHYDPDGRHFMEMLANNRAGLAGKNLPHYYAPPDPLQFYADLERVVREFDEAEVERFRNLDLTF